MDELQIFENKEFGRVRTTEINGKPYFMASDVARSLGYARPNDAISLHCKATVKHRIPISGKEQEVNFIPEGDIYRLIIRSKLPAAEKFESWVFDEVIPTIRRTGSYNLPRTYSEALEQLLIEVKEKEELQAQLDTSKEWYSIKRVADLNRVSWKEFDWRKLKEVGSRLGYDVKKIFDANYGLVNTYHREVWETVYPQYEL